MCFVSIRSGKITHAASKAAVITLGLSSFSLMQSLGADEVINYREQDFAEIYKDPSKHFDAVVDLIGGTPSQRPISC